MSAKLLTTLLFLTFAVLGTASSLQTPAPSQPDAAPRVDHHGDPLPPGALARCGSNRLRLTDHVSWLLFSPDSKILAVCRVGGILSLWDADTAKLRHLISPERNERGMSHAVFSADSKRLSCVIDNNDPECIVVDVDRGEVVSRSRMERDQGGAISSFARLSPDGTIIAVARDFTLHLYDAASGRETARSPLPVNHGKRWEFCISPDGQTIAVCAIEDRVRFYHAATGQWSSDFHVPGALFWRGAFSPSGKRFAVAPFNFDDQAKAKVPNLLVWDWATRRPLFQETMPESHRIEQLVFSLDDQHLAHDLGNRSTVIRDVTTGKVVKEIPFVRPSIQYAFSPNGKLFAAGYMYRVSLWETGTWRNLSAQVDPLEQATVLQFSPDGQRLEGLGNIGITWEARTGKQLRHHAFPIARPGYSESLSPGGLQLAWGEAGKITLGDSVTGKILHTWEGLKGHIRLTRFTADGRRLVAFGEDAGFLIYDLASKQLLQRLPIPHCNVFALSPDQRWLAISPMYSETNVELWDLANGRRSRVIEMAWHTWALAFTPDSSHLVAGGYATTADERSNTGVITFWDVATGTVGRSCSGKISGVYRNVLTLSRDGRMLISGDGNRTIYLWEVASGKARKEFRGHNQLPHALVLSPDERLLASASAEAPVYVWEVRDPQVQPLTAAELEPAWLDLHSHDASVAFKAIQRFATTPKLTVPFLQPRLPPVQAITAERVRQLLTQMDNRQFTEREKAASELQQVADQVLPQLRQALRGQLSPEVRRQLEEIVRQAETTAPDLLRSLRAVEALEWIGTPEVLPVLDRLASGAPDATLTKEAKASAQRLREKPRG
jgi:WD40 repeat protein